MVKKIKRKFRWQAGFTLIEMLTALAVFLIAIGSIVGLFLSAIRNQMYILANQELFNQTSYALEYMSRSLRMARKDIDGNCIGKNNNYIQPNSSSTIRFLNYQNKCQEFLLESGQLKEKKSSDNTSTNLGSALPLTSDSLQINSLSFNLIGQDQTDNLQPKVTIILDISSRAFPSPPRLRIQTTISQRSLDIQR